MSETKPIQPRGEGWKIDGVIPQGIAWFKRMGPGWGYYAISSVVRVNEPHYDEPHDQWLVSFSLQRVGGRGPERIPNFRMDVIKAEWGIQEFEEDNHEAGGARKFWLPVPERFRGIACPCKDEIVITEGDYSYSLKKPLAGERKST